MNVSLSAIGLTSLYGLPYVLKFLWGPVVDRYSTKRAWTLWAQVALSIVFTTVALAMGSPWGVAFAAVAMMSAAVISATNDIAIDGYYMEALDEEGQAQFVGYRVMAYRIAMMAGTGVIVTVGATEGWQRAYMLASAILVVLFLYHLAFLPRVENKDKAFAELLGNVAGKKTLLLVLIVLIGVSGGLWILWRQGSTIGLHYLPWLRRLGPSGAAGALLLIGLGLLFLFRDRIERALARERDSFYARAFLSYLDREGMGAVLAFIITMRLGESMLTSMAAPFMVDLGIKMHYGWISGGVGLPSSIAGAMLGGWLIARFSLRKMALPFLLAQNITNLVYMAMAMAMGPYLALNTGSQNPVPLKTLDLLLVASVHGFDQFAGGLGTAVLVTFIMRTCLPQFKAAHFAVGTGLMNISSVIAGVISGFLAQALGYARFFGISFLASVPAMILLLSLPLDGLHSATREKNNLTGSGRFN